MDKKTNNNLQNRQYNGQKEMDKQWPTKYYT